MYNFDEIIDRRVDKFVLADHHAQIDHLDAIVTQGMFDDLVADCVAIRADDTKDDRFCVHDCFCLSRFISIRTEQKKNVRIPRRLKTDVHSKCSRSGICDAA